MAANSSSGERLTGQNAFVYKAKTFSKYANWAATSGKVERIEKAGNIPGVFTGFVH